MTRFTQNGVKFEWDELCEKAFQELKRRLTTTPILIVPEQGQRYTVYCNASRDELGFVLMRSKRVVAYVSRQLRIMNRITLHMIWSWRPLPLP